MKRWWSIAALVALVALAWPIADSQAQGDRPAFRPGDALARLRSERGTVRARFDRATGGVRLLEGTLGTAAPGAEQGAARQFFARYAALFGLDDANADLAPHTLDRDGRGYTSVRFRQQYNGIAVEGGDIRADFDRAGTLHSVHGTLVPYPRPARLLPRWTPAQAIERARQQVGGGAAEGRPALVIVRHSTVDHLAWRVVVRTLAPALWRVEIDALTGRVLDQQQTLPTDKRIETYDARGLDDLPGELRRTWPQPPVDDPDINAAHDNAAQVYDYLLASFGRDSLDGNGVALVSTVHYRDNYNNAFWDPGLQQVVYGDGDGILLDHPARSLDVAAHEFVHGLTQYTAQLSYVNQSGALNEALSDIFGALIDDANWEIAETVYTPGVPDDALRSLAEPTRYGQPSVWGEYIVLPANANGDNGGVHLNSGIVNHVAYAIAQKLGRPKLAQIAYRTLAMKLTSTSDFLDMRDLALQACAELVAPPINPPITASDCRVVGDVFASAGWPSEPAPPASFRIHLPLVSNGLAACAPDAVRNGGFEDGQRAWPNTGPISGAVVDAWNETQAGERSARIDGDTQLLQLIRRDTTGEFRLTFDVWKDQSATDDTLLVDWEHPTTYADLLAPTEIGAELPSGVWTPVTVEVDDLADTSTFRLLFRHGDGGGQFYIDNISITQDC